MRGDLPHGSRSRCVRTREGGERHERFLGKRWRRSEARGDISDNRRTVPVGTYRKEREQSCCREHPEREIGAILRYAERLIAERLNTLEPVDRERAIYVRLGPPFLSRRRTDGCFGLPAVSAGDDEREER